MKVNKKNKFVLKIYKKYFVILVPIFYFIQPIDIGAELTGGCFGFATKYMHWPEDVLVGGVTKNKTGHIVRSVASSCTLISIILK